MNRSNGRNGRRFIGILLTIALLILVCGSPAKAAVEEPEAEDQGRLAALDQTVKSMLEALERGDYDGFSAHYKPGKKHGLSDGGSAAALSKEQFDAVRARFLNNGRRLAAIDRMSSSAGGRMQDAKYRLEFENRDIVAKLYVLGSRDAIERGVVDFSLRWVDRGRLEAAECLAENLVRAVYDDDYAAFAKGFSPALRQKYTPEEFRYLRKHLLTEKGGYLGSIMEDFSFDERERTTSTGRRLAFANDIEGREPVRLYMESSDEGAPKVLLARIDWLSEFEQQRMERLAETAMTAFLNEGDYEKFLACSAPELEADLPPDQFEELRHKLLKVIGKYRGQSFFSMRLEWQLSGGETNWLGERRIFVYKAQCEKTDAVFLHLMADRVGERFYLRGFQFQFPFVTEHIGDV